MRILIYLFSSILIGCGGGGEGSAPRPSEANTPQNQSPIGLWTGVTSQGTEFVGLVTADEFYIISASEYQSRMPANVVYGQWRVSGNSFESINAQDISIQYEQVSPVTISGNVNSNQQFNGTLDYGTLGTMTFTSSFNSKFNRQASIEEITGLTRGVALRESGYDNTIARIQSNGQITGQTYYGCSFTGQMSASLLGNYYTTTISSSCEGVNISVDALAYYDEDSNDLVILGFGDTPDRGIVYWGAMTQIPSTETIETSPLASTPSLSKAEGFWVGSSIDNRIVNGFITSDGEGYFIYSGQSSNNIAGVTFSKFLNSENGAESLKAVDFSFESSSVFDLEIDAVITSGSVMETTLDYGNLGINSVSLVYDGNYEITANLSDIEGTYNGFSAISAGTQSVQVTINSNGVINGISQLGCVIQGFTSPRQRGNIFDLSISFNSSQCLYPYQTFIGILVKTESGQLIATAPNNTYTDGILFISQ